ncbi:uncharacterized protein ACN63O_020720 [Diretmus argenteus]
MSISRKNWSALSSLALQWTAEDKEEVERERRRRVKSSTDTDDLDNESLPRSGQTPTDTPTNDSTQGTDSTSERSQGLSGVEQLQLDFVEILRARDEKRRMRHVETLRRQKKDDENEEEDGRGGGARVELLGDTEEDEVGGGRSTHTRVKPSHPPTPAPLSLTTTTTTITNRQHENGESRKDSVPKPPSNTSRKFVSSVSISLDKSPSGSGSTTPMSPRSPTASMSPREHWSSPCQSPSPRGAQSPIHTQEASTNGPASRETTRPAITRQSSRTASFRMMRKKEEERMPLERSVRMASKKFEFNTDQNQDEGKTSPFQRSSQQRISSRSIQEKMERLAQASQKSEVMRYPDVTQRTLCLLDEVSRKRGLFEKEQQAPSGSRAPGPSSPGVSRQEFRSFTSGMSDRINRWLNKSDQPSSSYNATDLRHVDITSRKSLFESREEVEFPKAGPGKI